jgi:D-beta-D-heptose 7-phosphate kinase/D-beta-D-heptose 1-phosphate adenosyltransferase
MPPRDPRSKIKSAAALARVLSRARKQGRKVVFTNGCFDLLHRGHVNYLARARRLGALLVVGLNNDASVRRLKGRGRPVSPLSDRLEVLAALESVDFVTSFSEDTPLRLIRKLRPDILVKGGDYQPNSIVGAPEVKSWGGRVRTLPLVRGRSTTGILARVVKL